MNIHFPDNNSDICGKGCTNQRLSNLSLLDSFQMITSLVKLEVQDLCDTG